MIRLTKAYDVGKTALLYGLGTRYFVDSKTALTVWQRKDSSALGREVLEVLDDNLYTGLYDEKLDKVIATVNCLSNDDSFNHGFISYHYISGEGWLTTDTRIDPRGHHELILKRLVERPVESDVGFIHVFRYYVDKICISCRFRIRYDGVNGVVVTDEGHVYRSNDTTGEMVEYAKAGDIIPMRISIKNVTKAIFNKD